MEPIRAVGVDPGTLSLSIFGIEGDKVILDEDIPTKVIAEDPKKVIDIIASAEPDIIAGPSGYGVPVKAPSELTQLEEFTTILLKKDDKSLPVLEGVKKMIEIAISYNLPMYLIPSVILLPTVPKYRKYNKIDMGAADKLCVTVLGVYDQSRRLEIEYKDVSFILAEIGGAYTSIIGVEGGVIVDGIGGTQGPMGFINMGRLDGEVAYILGEFKKALLFEGGVISIVGKPDITVDEFFSKVDKDSTYYEAYIALIEDIARFINAMKVSVRNPREILISGRLSGYKKLLSDLEDFVGDIAPIVRVSGFKASKAKHPAQGAAIVADGLGGGPRKDLIDHMRIREASGTVLDYVLLSGWMKRVKEVIGIE